jgi:hypothetical protein
MREETVKEAFRQYEDGAITYIEFVRKAIELVTHADVLEHNEYFLPHKDLHQYMAEFPFRG